MCRSQNSCLLSVPKWCVESDFDIQNFHPVRHRNANFLKPLESCDLVKCNRSELADDSQSVGKSTPLCQKTVCSRVWHWQHVFKTSLYFADWTKAKCDHLSLWWIKKKSLLICLKITVPLISLSHRQTFIQITFSLSLTVPPISQSLSLSHTHSSPDLPLTHTLRITVNLLVCQWSPWKN